MYEFIGIIYFIADRPCHFVSTTMAADNILYSILTLFCLQVKSSEGISSKNSNFFRLPTPGEGVKGQHPPEDQGWFPGQAGWQAPPGGGDIRAASAR